LKNLKLLSGSLLYLFLIGSTHAFQKEACPNPDLVVSPQVEEMDKQNCEKINLLNRCKERKVDPDALKKRITARLNGAEANGEKIIKLIKEKRRVSTKNLFVETAGSPGYSFLFDVLSGLDPELDRVALKERVIAGYLKFAEKNDCTPVVNSHAIWRICPAKLKVEGNRPTDERLIRQKLKDPLVEQERLKCLSSSRGDNGIKRLQICSTNPVIQSRIPTHRRHPACAGNFIQNFKDNKWDIANIDELLSSGALGEELLKCMKQRIKEGAKIKTISIRSSSNLLNNTAGAAKRFCKKGFKALSEARSDYAKQDLVPLILKAAGMENPVLTEAQFKVNSFGDNKDGTSGPCPYQYKDGVESLKPEFRKGGSRRAEIEKGKYLKVSISFEEKVTPLHNQKYHFKVRHRCRRVIFKCAD
jgi:hypothetical protein